MRRSIAIPIRPTTANRLLLRSFSIEMTIAAVGQASLFSLFWSIQPPCEIDEAILFDMTDKRTVAWVISMVLTQACTRSAVGGNNVSPECNVLRNRPGRVMTRIVLMVHPLANFPSTRPRKSLQQLFVRLQLQNKLKGKINNGRKGFSATADPG